MFARTIRWTMAAGSLLVSSGCAMCCGVYDQDYLATSELLQRSDPSQGRVGSVFSDPQAGFASPTSHELPEQLPTPRESPGILIPPPPPSGATRELIQKPTPAPAQPVGVPAGRPVPRSVIGSTTGPTHSPRRMTAQAAAPLQPGVAAERGPIRQTGGPAGR
jgi:hypothetical protein